MVLTWIGVGAFGAVWGWLFVMATGSVRGANRGWAARSGALAGALAPLSVLPWEEGSGSALLFVGAGLAFAGIHVLWRSELRARRSRGAYS